MKKRALELNSKERQRQIVLSQVQQKIMSLKQAATLLKVSYSQVRRIYKIFCLEGESGLVHKNRGKAPGKSKPKEFKNAVLTLYKEKYFDFGPTLAAEKLEIEGFKISRETLRNWLIEAGLWETKAYKRPYRKRRKSRPHFGEMIQLDGSDHNWFEDRGAKCCLMVMIDDATNTSEALLCPQETTEGAMRLLFSWIKKYGIPHSLYTDRHSVYYKVKKYNFEPQYGLTQFGRACKELGIHIIYAKSPQAKGRVEKWNAVYQDRLVKEMRLLGLSSIEEGNEYLQKSFLHQLNQKFSLAAESEIDFHSDCPSDEELQKILSISQERLLSNDWVIQFDSRQFQILEQPNLPSIRSKLEVREFLDKSIHIFCGSQELKYQEITKCDKKKDIKANGQSNYELKKALYKQMKVFEKEGMSQRMIAKKTGLSRNTIAKYLKKGGLPKNTRRKRESILNPYKKQIKKWLNDNDIPATEIFKRLQKYGYQGSYNTVKSYVRSVKQSLKYPTMEVNIFSNFADQVQFWLQTEEALSGKDVFIRLVALGYTGSYETSQKYVRQMKKEIQGNKLFRDNCE